MNANVAQAWDNLADKWEQGKGTEADVQALYDAMDAEGGDA